MRPPLWKNLSCLEIQQCSPSAYYSITHDRLLHITHDDRHLCTRLEGVLLSAVPAMGPCMCFPYQTMQLPYELRILEKNSRGWAFDPGETSHGRKYSPNELVTFELKGEFPLPSKEEYETHGRKRQTLMRQHDRKSPPP